MKLKKVVLAKIAHEFKTPLITLINYIKLLQDELSSNNFNSEYINSITGLSKYASFLVTDIIDYSKTDSISNKIELKFNNEKVYKILNFVFDITKTIISMNSNKEKAVKPILFSNINDQNFVINTDEFRLKQVLLNFASNAIKFTSYGNITLYAKLLPESMEIEFGVEDSGTGISDQDIEKLFNDFVMLETHKKTNSTGSGLGLTISQNIVKHLGSEIKIKSEIGKGSTFYFRIKLDNLECTENKQESSNGTVNYNQDIQTINNECNECIKFLNINILAENEESEDCEESEEESEEESKILDTNNKVNQAQSISPHKKPIQQDNNEYIKLTNIHTKEKEEEEYNIIDSSSARILKTKQIFIPKAINSERNPSNMISRKTRISHKCDQTIKYPFKIYPEIIDKLINNTNKLSSNSHQKKEFLKDLDICNEVENQKQHLFEINFEEASQGKKENKQNIFNKDNKSNDNDNNNNDKIVRSISSKDSKYNKTNKLIKDNSKEKVKRSKVTKVNTVKSNTIKPKRGKNESLLSILVNPKIRNTSYVINNIANNEQNYFNKLDKDVENGEIKKKKMEYLQQITSTSLLVVNDIVEKKENEILPKILVIEDNQMISKSIINNLKAITNGKYNILLGVDGIDTLKFVMDDQFEGNQIKLIITDENMQFMNGSESLRILKNLEFSGKIKGTKIVVSTTLIDSSMNDYFIKLGVFKVIDKAFEKSKMKQLLQELNLL